LMILLQENDDKNRDTGIGGLTLSQIMKNPHISYSGIEILKQIDAFSGFDETLDKVAPWEFLIRNANSKQILFHESLATDSIPEMQPLTTSIEIVKIINRNLHSFLSEIGNEGTANILTSVLSLLEDTTGDDVESLRSTISYFIKKLSPLGYPHSRKVH